jgi:hypothetical protein
MYEIVINGHSFSVDQDFISGTEIKNIGMISENHMINFHVKGLKDPIQINDNDMIDLTRPGAEYFTSINF